MKGKIHNADSLYLSKKIGEAEDPDTGSKYELLIGMAGAPIIRNTKTGLSWSIGWPELVAQAVLDGIDEETAK